MDKRAWDMFGGIFLMVLGLVSTLLYRQLGRGTGKWGSKMGIPPTQAHTRFGQICYLVGGIVFVALGVLFLLKR